MSSSNNSSPAYGNEPDHGLVDVDPPPLHPCWRSVAPQLLALYDEGVEPVYAYQEFMRMAHFADVAADVVDDLLRIMALARSGDTDAVRQVAQGAIQRFEAVAQPAQMTLEKVTRAAAGQPLGPPPEKRAA